MRRSSKFAIASAFGIALAAAQVGPYVIQRVEQGKVEQRRAIRAQALAYKLETISDDDAYTDDILMWLLTWVQ